MACRAVLTVIDAAALQTGYVSGWIAAEFPMDRSCAGSAMKATLPLCAEHDFDVRSWEFGCGLCIETCITERGVAASLHLCSDAGVIVTRLFRLLGIL